MSTTFPTALDTFINPSETDTLDSTTVPHAAQHANANDAIEALQAKVGITGSTDATSLDYRVAAVETGKVDKVAWKQLSTEDYSTAEKTKLAGIETGANAYTHPETHPATMIVEDSTHRFVTDTQTAAWDSKAAGTHAHAISDVTGLTTALSGKLDATEKGAANGLAPLGADSKIASTYLPSYVVEAANFAALPETGEAGKIYVTLDTNKTYRWSGTAYTEITASPGSTDAVTEGASNLYFTYARVRDTVLTGLSTATNAVIAATDSVLSALGKLQAQITGHTGNTSNPHSVTKAQLGLDAVDNTADSTKQVLSATKLTTARTLSLTGDVTGSASFDGSANAAITATVEDDSHNHIIANVDGLQTALDGKSATTHTHAGVYEPVDATILRNVNIGSTVQGYSSTLTSWAGINPTVKQDALVSGTNIKTINGQSILGAGNIEIQGGVGVALSGDANIYVTQAKTYTITNYNVFSSYIVQVSAGSVSIAGDQITFTAPATAQTVTLTVTMDSAATQFSLVVQAAGVAAPTITSPANGATDQPQAPTFTTSAFATIGLADTFLYADHEVRTGPNGTGTLIASSYADTGSETSWAMPGSLLATATTYYYRKLHRGTALGASGWSEISFTTAATFGGLIGTQGGQGFGVGVCVDSARLTALGLSEMTGTTDKTHANYGNYQHTNSGISVYRPKFFYRIGHPSSPRFATYGANAVDIVGIETFANEAAANAAGYAMSRSFKNAGVEVDGYFRDKYLASKDGTTSCKSIANANPISLTTNASYNPSSAMTGCTGILADAVVLARARGAGWNADFFPMAFDSAIIALAHGQASTSSTYCAWYDAAGVTNFPKGCNNGSLADVNDATVTYTASYSTKPKTRANANFAKTTDNGQECGIADVNGSMLQVMIGLTMAGTSGTDTTAITSGNAYLLKTTADFAALTGGFGGTHDAWGTTSSLTTDFDLITGFEPWLGTTGWIYFGNGANAVFSNAASGTDYLRTCAGIPLLTGTNATGTSQFGNDGCYQYGRANQVPLAAGNWGGAAAAGAFSRYWTGGRSGDSSGYGFRCAAY